MTFKSLPILGVRVRRQDDRLTPDLQEFSVCVHARASVGTYRVAEGL